MTIYTLTKEFLYIPMVLTALRYSHNKSKFESVTVSKFFPKTLFLNILHKTSHEEEI